MVLGEDESLGGRGLKVLPISRAAESQVAQKLTYELQIRVTWKEEAEESTEHQTESWKRTDNTCVWVPKQPKRCCTGETLQQIGIPKS